MKTTAMLDIVPHAGPRGARDFRRAPGGAASVGRRAGLAIACLAFGWTALCGNSARSAILTWSSTATGASWNAASNWGGAVPGSADIGLFSAASYTSQPSLTSTAAVGGIWDTGSGAVTISGTTLTITGADAINGDSDTGIELNFGAGSLAVNAPLVLANNQQWINDSANPLMVNGNISGPGSLTEIGSGMMTLTGSNTLNGGLTVDGGTLQAPSGSLSTVSNEYIGNAGTGVFLQSGGSNSLSYLYLGYQNGSNGTYNLSGSGRLSTANIAVGYSGNGSFTQCSGTNSVSSSLYVGRAGGNGIYNLNGSGLLSGQLEIIGYSGTGSLSQSGGMNMVSGFLAVGQDAASVGSYTLTGGSLQSAGQEVVGQSGSGAFAQSGGTNSISTILYLGNAASGTGVYNLSGSGLLSGQSEFISYSGSGTFTQSGGTNSVSSALILGNAAGAAGTYDLSGSGLLSAATETIGNSGSGAFTQTGGSHAVSGQLTLGAGSGGVGVFNLSGSGLLSTQTEVVGASGTGAFTQTGGTNTITGALYLGSSLGASGAYSLSAGLLVVPTIIQGAGLGALDITGGTLTGGAGQLTISTPIASLTVAGEISGSGSLTKTGSADLVLAGGNTYTGDTTVAQGALVLANSNAAQNTTVGVGLNNGLLFSGGIGTFNVGSVGGSGNLALADTGGHPITLVTGGNNANTTYGGIISGPGVLVHNGSGSLVLTGSNTYSGGTIVGPDDLVVGNSSALGSGPFTYSSGSATLILLQSCTLSNTFILDTDVTGTIDTGMFNLTLNGPVIGAGGLNKSGAGTLILNLSNVFAGGMSIGQGTLQLASAEAVQNSTVNLGVDNGLQFAPGIGVFEVGGLSGSNALTLNDTGGSAVTLAVGGNNANTMFSGPISGNGSLLKEGSGMMALTASSSWTGGLTIDPGVVAINSDAALGAPAASIHFAGNGALEALDSFALSASRNIVIAASCTATFNPGGNTLIIAGPISGGGALAVTGSGTLVLTNSEGYIGGTTINSAALQLGNGGSTGWLTGNIVDNGLLVFDRSDSPTFAGVISGSGVLQQAGAGTLWIGGTNSFTGTAILTAGTLALGNANALQDATVLSFGGTLDLNNFGATLGALGGSGSLPLSNGTLTVGGNGSSTNFAGTLSGPASLVKTGSGLFVLSGSNSYSGLTIINAGALEAATTSSIPGVLKPSANPLSVAPGAMLAVGVGGSQQWTTANIGSLLAIPSLFGSGGTIGIDTSGGNFSETGLAGGNLALVKLGLNTLTLTGTNSYLGGTLVSGGALEATTTSALPGVFTPGDVSVASGATLTLAVGGSQQWVTANVNSLLAIPGLFNPGASLGFDTNGGNFSFGSIGDSNSSLGLTIVGSNRLTLTGSNAFTGVTNVSQGTLQLANPAALLESTVALASDNGLQFLPGIGEYYLGGLSGGNLLKLSDTAGGAVALIVGGNGASTTFSGDLTGGGSLIKIGAGALVLDGADEYLDGTTVDDGTLCVTNSEALPADTSLTIAAGGTFVFDPTASAAPVAGIVLGSTPLAALRSVAAVPEPGTLALLAAGALLAFAAARRRTN